ncbi:hypothetical protein AB0P17_11180 [Streptomyces sp. NPDC088124]|uniref:hypothetical protein n=1 Tax=Streptomyces sp. NPDC088124 TaxID=3154654 RepID=UPI0034176FE4
MAALVGGVAGTSVAATADTPRADPSVQAARWTYTGLAYGSEKLCKQGAKDWVGKYGPVLGSQCIPEGRNWELWVLVY